MADVKTNMDWAIDESQLIALRYAVNLLEVLPFDMALEQLKKEVKKYEDKVNG